jgi:hypothetical protein
MYGTGAGDRLWFYDNGDVISTNNAKIIGYHLNDKGVLELWSEPWSKEKLPDNTYWKIGDLKRVGNNVTLIETEENKRRRGVKPKAAEEHPLLDKIQFGLDIAGMFPIVGDILDVVNAGISLFRIYYFKEDIDTLMFSDSNELNLHLLRLKRRYLPYRLLLLQEIFLKKVLQW